MATSVRWAATNKSVITSRPGACLHSAMHHVLHALTTACAQEEEDKRAKQGEAHIVARTAKAKKAELSDLERMLARCASLVLHSGTIQTCL